MNNKIGAIGLPVHRVHLELTNVCNFSCEFCPDSKMKRKKGYMQADMAKAILDEVSSSGLAEWVFLHVMGEPTLHPGLTDIAAYAGSKGLKVSITTNGSRLDLPLLRSLSGAGVRQIVLSLQTPDEKTFAMRGAKDLPFEEYVKRIITVAREVINNPRDTELVVSFLSSPLRRLIIPIAGEFSIADTTGKLRNYLALWAERLLKDTPAEAELPRVRKKIGRAGCFRENSIQLTDRLSFHTRIVGDWATHFDRPVVRARFGYCNGIQQNFGILWNGDYVYCCADYDGRTSSANFRDVSVAGFLHGERVQRTVKGFQRFRVLDSHCQSCIGDPSRLNSFVKQIGSILYFSVIKKHKVSP